MSRSASWPDIWLNEGFATYASWLWLEHDQGPQTLAAMVEETWDSLEGRRFGPLSDPGVDAMFSSNVYGRGALTLHALRLTVGDEVFFAIVEEWASRYEYGNATTEDFISLVGEVATNVTSDLLAEFFDAWLDQEPLPALPGAGPSLPGAEASSEEGKP